MTRMPAALAKKRGIPSLPPRRGEFLHLAANRKKAIYVTLYITSMRRSECRWRGRYTVEPECHPTSPSGAPMAGEVPGTRAPPECSRPPAGPTNNVSLQGCVCVCTTKPTSIYIPT